MGSPTANIKPLKTNLARVYNMSEHQVVDRLLLGPLYSLRGKVIHEGKLFSNGLVLNYMQALLADLVDDMLGAPPRRLAPAMIDGVPGQAVLRAAIR